MSAARRAAILVAVLAVLAARQGAARPCSVDSDCQTFGGKCQVGTSYCDVDDTCTPLVTQSCDDGDVCTDDSCSNLAPGNGCVHTPHCPDDGQVCNGIEVCVPTPFGPVTLPLCLPGIPPNCDDGNACTIDGCAEPGGCTHVAVNCDDGDLCTQDVCDVQQGCLHIPKPGCCKTIADCTQDACSSGVQCVNHLCTAGQATSCDDGDVCTFDGCDPGTGCTHTPIAGCCHNDTDCATSDDPCAGGGCGATHTCDAQPKVGLDAVTCACARHAPAACGGQTVPASVTKRVQHACMLASAPGTGAKEIRSLARGATLLGKAARTLAGPGGKGVSADCIVALKGQIGDLHGRMASLADQI